MGNGIWKPNHNLDVRKLTVIVPRSLNISFTEVLNLTYFSVCDHNFILVIA